MSQKEMPWKSSWLSQGGDGAPDFGQRTSCWPAPLPIQGEDHPDTLPSMQSLAVHHKIGYRISGWGIKPDRAGNKLQKNKRH